MPRDLWGYHWEPLWLFFEDNQGLCACCVGSPRSSRPAQGAHRGAFESYQGKQPSVSSNGQDEEAMHLQDMGVKNAPERKDKMTPAMEIQCRDCKEEQLFLQRLSTEETKKKQTENILRLHQGKMLILEVRERARAPSWSCFRIQMIF